MSVVGVLEFVHPVVDSDNKCDEERRLVDERRGEGEGIDDVEVSMHGGDRKSRLFYREVPAYDVAVYRVVWESPVRLEDVEVRAEGERILLFEHQNDVALGVADIHLRQKDVEELVANDKERFACKVGDEFLPRKGENSALDKELVVVLHIAHDGAASDGHEFVSNQIIHNLRS